VARLDCRRWLGLLAAFAVACLPAPTVAATATESVRLILALYDTGPLPPDRDDVLSGRYDSSFSEVPLDGLRIGPPGRTFWLRLDISLPAASERDLFEGHWLLALNRVPAETIEVYVEQDRAGWSTQPESFFQPGVQALTLGGGFFFRLPRDSAQTLRLYMKVVSEVRVDLNPRIVREGDTLAADRGLSNVFTAIYTAFLVLLVINLILYAALRDPAYLAFVAWGGAVFMLVLSVNGHLYGVYGLGWLGRWGALGIHAFAFLSAASSVWLFRAFADSARFDALLDRSLKWYGWGLLGLALLCVPNARAWVPAFQLTADTVLVATSLLLLVASLRVWKAGSTMARAFFWVWLLLCAFVLVRVALEVGVPVPHGIGLYGYQVGAAMAAFLFSVVLAERVIEFRHQRDRAKLLKDQVDATLRLEQMRRSFVDGLQEVLARSSAGDAEWVALKRLMTDLPPLIPQQCSAVIVKGHEGRDYLFCEPPEEKEHFGRLLKARIDALRGICRARTPMVVKLEEPGEGEVPARHSTYAVVPLPLAGSGWGALLLERSAWEDFTSDELKTAQEFARVALDTAKQMMSHVNLQREAESDPLTGALNRRAGDGALEAALKSAIGQRLPLTVLFVDLDFFKAVNDMHGHAVGDCCLIAVAEIIASQLDAGDSLSRYGGEEFQVVLPGRSLAQARELAERMRKVVANTKIDCNGLKLTLTISIGVAARQAEDSTIQTLQERADKALYKAKASGRNCVATLAPTDFGGHGIPGIY
jgi:diguanylate cyclase (GGDEF)-like protein